jgi:hypothetical protein
LLDWEYAGMGDPYVELLSWGIVQLISAWILKLVLILCILI